MMEKYDIIKVALKTLDYYLECDKMLNFKLKLILKHIQKMDNKYYVSAERPKGCELIEDLVYNKVGKKELKLDLARPEKRNRLDSLPVIINIHGGGWVYGCKDSYYKYYGMNLSLKGFAVLTFDYRLAPKYSYPDPIEDVYELFKWIEENSEKYKLDTERVFLVGDSAGANIAALIGCILSNRKLEEFYGLHTKIKPAALGLNCGVYDFDNVIELGQAMNFPQVNSIVRGVFGTKKYKELPIYQKTSILKNVNKQFLPCYIMGSETDGLFPETKKMIDVLNLNGVEHKEHVVPKNENLNHVFHLRDNCSMSDVVMEEMTEFFKQI